MNYEIVSVSKERLAKLILFVLVLLSACNTKEIVPHELMLSVYDLPSGWSHDPDIGHPKEPGADTRADTFHFGRSEYWLVLSHYLAVYADAASAKQAFAAWESKWFPAIALWATPATASFVPSDPSDLYRLGCEDLVLDVGTVTACRLLQQHDDFISFVQVNLDPQAMTLAQFEQVLSKLDQRFQAWDTTATSTP